MPTFTDNNHYKHTYATEAELLDFANKVREAGGGNPIEALFPSTVGNSSACLIANALNFDCQVDAVHEDVWTMTIADGPNEAERHRRIRAIAEATGCKIWYVSADDPAGIFLPPKIGNAAHAFDIAKRGWVTKYRDSPIPRPLPASL